MAPHKTTLNDLIATVIAAGARLFSLQKKQ
jgi:hypothetical protein